jgi:UDP-N-acetylmuramate: L-alanyl-gamma-D-glutamyl-meso-diaminopimelate ligase
MGCWTPVEWFVRSEDSDRAERWSARAIGENDPGFVMYRNEEQLGEVHWDLLGRHNVDNALAAVLAARHAGVPVETGLAALGHFRGVRRRLERRAVVGGIAVYDDFAHHPTAIAATLEGLRRMVGAGRIVAVVEPRSNTMKMGVHRDQLAPSLTRADEVLLYQPPDLGWSLEPVAAALGPQCRVFAVVQAIIDHVAERARPGDHIVIMSNGGFENIHSRLIEALRHGR